MRVVGIVQCGAQCEGGGCGGTQWGGGGAVVGHSGQGQWGTVVEYGGEIVGGTVVGYNEEVIRVDHSGNSGRGQ